MSLRSWTPFTLCLRLGRSRPRGLVSGPPGAVRLRSRSAGPDATPQPPPCGAASTARMGCRYHRLTILVERACFSLSGLVA